MNLHKHFLIHNCVGYLYKKASIRNVLIESFHWTLHFFWRVLWSSFSWNMFRYACLMPVSLVTKLLITHRLLTNAHHLHHTHPSGIGEGLESLRIEALNKAHLELDFPFGKCQMRIHSSSSFNVHSENQSLIDWYLSNFCKQRKSLKPTLNRKLQSS